MTNDEHIKQIMSVGGFAFPGSAVMSGGGTYHEAGMTLRDYFAAQALAMSIPSYVNLPDSAPLLARRCYAIADAMLEERSE